MTLDQLTIFRARLEAATDWVGRNYRPKPASVDLVCSSEVVLEIFAKHNKHTAFYQIPQIPELVERQRKNLEADGFQFAEYGSIDDKTLATAPQPVSITT